MPEDFLNAWDEVLRTRGHTSMANVFALLANSPGAMSVVTQVGAYVRFDTDFDNVLRELVILTVAQEVRCEYEWKHHWRVAEKAGAEESLLKKVGSAELEAELAPVGLAVRYARLLTNNETIDDALFNELKAEFGEPGFVDLTVLIGYYGMLARFINTVRIPVEDGYDDITFNR